jgi:hypothetical protein
VLLMKKIIVGLCGFSVVATLLCGCGQSKSDSATGEQKPTASPAAPSAAAPPVASSPATPPSTNSVAATPAPLTALADSAAPIPAANTGSTAPPAATAPSTPLSTDAASQLVAAAKAQGDTVLSSVSGELADKVKALSETAAGNDTLKSQLSSSLKTLAGGNDSAGLSTLYQVAQSASLTPPQIQLAKEVGNLASAYVVQKNFASLDGAQGDVATIVNSLRQGQITPAIPAIQKVAQNANLTPTQKQLVASIADKYAPGVSKAAGAVGQGLQSIPGLGGK